MDEFVAHVEQLVATPGSALARYFGADWSAHEENTARLYESLHHWLSLEWTDRTTDPEDAELKRRRAQDKAAGIKPPPYPLVPPIALRPESLAEKRHRAYFAEVEQWKKPQVERERREVDSDEFDRILGLR